MGKKLQFSRSVLQGIRRPSQAVTGPVARWRAKGEGASASPSAREPGRMKSLLTLPLMQVNLYTVGGGVLLGLIAWAFGSGHFGLGLVLGSFLSLAFLYSLKALTTKVLAPGNPGGTRMFHAMNLVRWILLAVVFVLLLKISVACLLGAVASYIWFLGVLAWFGIRSAPAASPAPPSGPADKSK